MELHPRPPTRAGTSTHATQSSRTFWSPAPGTRPGPRADLVFSSGYSSGPLSVLITLDPCENSAVVNIEARGAEGSPAAVLALAAGPSHYGCPDLNINHVACHGYGPNETGKANAKVVLRKRGQGGRGGAVGL
jgi:hypothetical protein